MTGKKDSCINKVVRFFIFVSLLLTVFGCSSKDRPEIKPEEQYTVNTKYDTEVTVTNDYEYPSALGDLSEDGSVNSYIDFLANLERKQYIAENSAELVNKACEALYGKYEEMGYINLNNNDQIYSLLYIKTDGMYYPLDIFSQYKNKVEWMEGYEGDKYVFDKLSNTAMAVRNAVSDNAEVSTKAIYAKAVTGEVFDIDYEEFGMPIYRYDDFRVPLGLGLPALTREVTAAVKEENEAEMINTYPDLLMYLKDRTDYYDPPAPNLLHSYILLGDYDIVKLLKVKCSYEGENCVMILGNGEHLYVCDLFEKATAAKNMKIFPIVCGMKEFDSLEEVYDTFSKEFPWGGSVISAKIEEIDAPEKTQAPNGMTLNVKKRLGEDVFIYSDTEIPLGLGLPTLTYEEIDKLIEEKDAEKTREAIATVADAVCYLNRADYKFSGKNDLSKNSFNANNVGNIPYNKEDNFVYSISGAESLLINRGQCTSLSTLMQYLLKDDYDEMLYLQVCKTDDSHVLLCIRNGDRYYLINPVDYAKANRPDGTYEPMIRSKWLYFFSDDQTGSSSSLEELMHDVAKNEEILYGKLSKVITVDFDGVFCWGKKGEKSSYLPGNYSVFPEGSIATAWTPDSPIDYETPVHSISQTEIIGLADWINSN